MNKTFVCVALLLVVSLSACNQPAKTPPPADQGAATPAPGGGTTTVDAQAIYKQNCISCHGVNFEGGVGPNLTKVGGKYSKDQIATIVTNGRGGMPSFKGRLSDTDTSAISDWLAAKK
ncbi:c-type cytochrome [Paenibacillus tyrfis]|uniref:Cytochrome c-551 n=1 Tax=Paenibacillus tyrfis TaxID=1501230 RepID=A0A081P249_9BACL|nr:cytochrome c [Paenibacillus tyrfis]KEQ24772.1 cytochrome c-551 [Paenibacillus tyrfis]